MNKFKVGDKVVFIENPDYVFEIEESPIDYRNTYRFKDCKDSYDSEFIERCYRLATQEEIDTLLKDQEQSEHDLKTQFQENIICPCCYEEHGAGYEIDNANSFNFICNDCGEEFRVVPFIEITYSTERIEK